VEVLHHPDRLLPHRHHHHLLLRLLRNRKEKLWIKWLLNVEREGEVLL
jgi:hypothetical protein